MRYRLALANSLNIPAVKVLASIGGPAVLLQRLRSCGLTTLSDSPEHYGLGLTIGNAEARLLELANAYACLARLGEYKPYALLKAGHSGSGEARVGGQRLFEPTACFLIADILSDNSARVLEFGAESSLRFGFPAACKTGTSSDFRDNWAFGYTPEFTVGVWAGNFDGSPMQGISGVTGAAPIMHEIMQQLHKRFGTSWYATPGNIVTLPVQPVTGKHVVGLNQRPPLPEVVWEKFASDRLPPDELPQDYDSAGRVRLSAEYREWLGTSDNWLTGKAVVETGPASLRIVFPLPGTTFYLDPDLPDSGRRIHLKADGPAQVQWGSDTLQCQDLSGQSFAWLKVGERRLQVRDPQTGRQCETWVKVLQR
jgi:penicillin-binding protein 1C